MAWPENVRKVAQKLKIKSSDFAMMSNEDFDTFLSETAIALKELERKLLTAILSKDADTVKKVKEELTCRMRLVRAGQKENKDRIAINNGTKATN